MWQKVSVPNEDPVETYFLYDGDTLIAEVGLVGNDWQLVAEYVWGPLGPLMQRRYNPGTETWYNYYYVQDGLGHTRLLLDGAGNVKNRYAYDAWGNLIDYEEAVPNPFTWNGAYGYEWIPLTGLYHVGAREYDPRTARWLQRDPIEVSSGDPNFWRYCGNDPVNLKDPTGLASALATIGNGVTSGIGTVLKGIGIAIGGVVDGAMKIPEWALNSVSSVLGAVGLTNASNSLQAGADAIENSSEIAQSGIESSLGHPSQKPVARPYLVGTFRELRDCAFGTGMPAHHVPQTHPARQVIPGYDRETAPSILLPDARTHRSIPTRRGVYEGTASELIEGDLVSLLEKTNVSKKDYEALVELIRKVFPNTPFNPPPWKRRR